MSEATPDQAALIADVLNRAALRIDEGKNKSAVAAIAFASLGQQDLAHAATINLAVHGVLTDWLNMTSPEMQAAALRRAAKRARQTYGDEVEPME